MTRLTWPKPSFFAEQGQIDFIHMTVDASVAASRAWPAFYDELTVERWIESAGREAFEEEVFADYFIRGVKFVPNKQFAEVRNQKTKAELCERDGKYYKDEDISRMWHGWKLAIETLKRKK